MKKEWVSLDSSRVHKGLKGCSLFNYDDDPLDNLPALVTLSDYEQSLLDQMAEFGSSPDMVAFVWANHLAGPSDESCEYLRSKFKEIVKSIEDRGFKIPQTLQSVFSSNEIIRRFRTGYGGALLDVPDFVCESPISPGSLLILILQDEQMCGAWHLMLSRDGTGPVVFQNYPYGIDPEECEPPPEEPADFVIVSDSLEEFIWRASEEIKIYEKRNR